MTRESVIDLAAREIVDCGEVCVDTYMLLTNYAIEAVEVADQIVENQRTEEEAESNE